MKNFLILFGSFLVMLGVMVAASLYTGDKFYKKDLAKCMETATEVECRDELK